MVLIVNESIELKEHPDTVEEIMVDKYIAVNQNTSAEKTIEKFREQKAKPTDETTIYYIYVIDEYKHLVGVLSLIELLHAKPDKPVKEIMKKDVISLKKQEDPENAAKKIQKADLMSLPVVDDKNKLIGAVRFDDIMDVVDEEFSEDMYRLAGFSFTEEETARSTAILDSPIKTILKLRIPWLLVALVGGLLAGFVIDTYEETLEATLALAIFLPAIMDMGGNVGTQASTIFVRGTALGQIGEQNVKKHILKEGLVGLLIGILVGTIAGIAAYLWQGIPELGVVIFLSLTLTCIVASLIGYGIPWIAHKLGYDPAAVSDPFITTIKDVTALLIYFSLATALVPII
ncbi:Mg/Co/Ni transporter MgtE [Methanonatronarchaeum thermophilum]|uniref:Magnesium transporter MgtE n=1 Tax=Methanonatronarchaeum thermophilum TaxID=1927129 RepID=A0A1Y3GGR0_9EURY|nr:magnesium transporter [Methanonatronarchaeum thermophilum]OUJ18546.1 Mg/Co/Ni transporter MgtE [Methanonatronarchaeum thermophilum]